MHSTGLLGERISFGGARARGFALAAAGDPDIWASLSLPQQTWVANTLNTLNDLIVKGGRAPCLQRTPTIHGSGYCFQVWFNEAKLGLTKADGSPMVLRTDGMFDQDTLDALRTVAAMNAKDFPTPYPGTEMAGTGTTAAKPGLSKGAMFGIGTAGAAVLGGIIYAATRGGSKRKRK